MTVTFLALIMLIGRTTSLPIGSKIQHPEIVVNYSILTDCETNIQKQCIEVYGTMKNLLGNKNDSCNIKNMIDCFNAEKNKIECKNNDDGTVAYIDAFIKNVDMSHCMNEFEYTEVRELFVSALETGAEYQVTHRTYSSGDHAAFHDDSEIDDDAGYMESGSGSSSSVSSNV